MANIRKSFNFRSGLQVDNDNFVINPNGLVGIGTSSPSQYLCNIHGDLRVTGSIIGRDASFSGGLEVLGITTVGILTASSIEAPEARIGILTATQIQIGNGNTLTSLVGYAITDAWLVPDNIGIVTTRRVGIGTDLTPSEQLRVVGDTNITGTFTAGSIESNINVTNGISTFNDIRVGTGISISAGVITATTFDGNFTGTVTGTATTAQFLTDGANIIAGTISDDRLPDIITSNINILTGTSYFNQIGVGTNAPLSDIHVRKDVQTEIQVTSDSNAALIGLGRSNNITGYNGVFRYGNNDASFPYSDVYSLDIMNYGPGNINFYLNPSSVAGATGGFFWHNEANRLMALTSAGNLGIGITDPTNKFEVVGTSYVSGNAEFGDSVTVTNNVILGLNGRIGINSTSPTEKLDVVGNIVASGTITGSGIEADNINVVGFVTASQFKGDASQLTALTGAAGGTYGGATSVPQLIINNEGRITGINQVTIQQSTGGQIGIFSGGVEVGTGITALNFIGTGNTFAVSGATVDISIQGGGGGSSDPVGTIVAWSGSIASIPSEYQLCDGSAASTSALQAITGANVPDLRDRFIVGAGSTYSVGDTGGSANAVLIGHSHGTYGNESGYRHPVRAGTDATFDWDSHTADPNDATYDTNSRTDATGQNAAGISSTSQTGTNANLPPYYALCYIIKHTATASSGGGISGITVQDEGSVLSTTATTLNFVGAGVTASGTGATKTITINGGGSGGGGSSLWSSGIGSDIYYNSGDVGIGTTNPTAMLDVDGYTELDDVNISGVVTSTSFVKSGGTNLQYLMADGSISTVSGISTSDGDGIIAYANFDGTLSSPITARAQRGFSSITKTSSTNGRYTLTFATAQPNADYIVQATGGTNSTAVVNVLSATTTEIQLQTGTNSNGAVNLEYVYITVYDSLSGGTGIGTDGNVNTTGIITAHLGSFDNLYVSGVSTFAGNVSVNGLTGAGAIVFSSGSGLLRDDSNFSYNDPSNTLNVVNVDVSGHTELDDVNISGVSTFLGDVGIGSTSPTAKLDVDGTLNVSGISTFSDDLTIKNSSLKVTNTSTSGNYLEAYQDNSGAFYLNKVGLGAFFIEGNNIYIGDDGSNETYAGFQKDGSSYLNYDGTKRLETTGYGVTVTGGLNVSGIVTATSFVKSGGTSSQFLMADGSVSTGSVGGGLTDTSVAHNSIGIGSESLSSEAPDGVGNGEKNTALGYNAGKSTTSANSNNYFGYEAGYNTDTGGGNLYFGNQAGYNNTGGFSNIGIGNSALAGSNNNQNCIGIGYRAGGYGANFGACQNNVSIGAEAGRNLSGGDENVIIGAYAGTLLTGGTKNIVIGWGAQASNSAVYNEITLGGTGITSFRIPGLQSSASDGQVLTYNSSTDNIGFQTASTGGITVQDEGSALSTTATTLNFVGAGVTASGTGAIKTITINGGGGSGGGGGSSDPVGTIVAWAGSVASIPSDYQLCDGSAASTSALQAITGANVPDLRDRFVLGASNIAGTGTYPGVGVGSTGGSAVPGISSHTHMMISIAPAQGGLNTYPYLAASSSQTERYDLKGTSSFSPTLGETSSTGSNTTNGNLPPYYALCYIIKHTATASGGGGTVSSGNFTASAGSPSTLETYAYDSAELVFEYTVFVKNGSDYQTQKLLVMRDGTTVDSTQYAIMHSNGLLVQLDATISGSNLLLRATPETGVTGNTTYRIKREVV